jgi:hypothetical protein
VEPVGRVRVEGRRKGSDLIGPILQGAEGSQESQAGPREKRVLKRHHLFLPSTLSLGNIWKSTGVSRTSKTLG